MQPERVKQPLQERPAGRREGIGTAAPAQPAEPRKSDVAPGSVDIVGTVPQGVRIDPDITEGHPGYEESGDSELIRPERLTGEIARPVPSR